MTDKKTTVFVSYRRDDSGASAALLSYVLEQDERLTVLIDVDSIEIGRDYRDAIVEQITNADVVLAVIGRGWVSASDNKDGRRLDDVRDPVRLEIETALRLKKRLVPVLVDDASIPQGEDLPREIADLVTRNGVEMRHESFSPDARRLADSLARLSPMEPEPLASAEPSEAPETSHGPAASLLDDHVQSELDLQGSTSLIEDGGYAENATVATPQLTPPPTPLTPATEPVTPKQSHIGAVEARYDGTANGLRWARRGLILMVVLTAMWVAYSLAADSASIPKNAVATVAGESITKDTFNKWMAIAAKSQGQTDSEKSKGQVMQLLITSAWIEHQAKSMGVTVSDVEVRKQFDKTKRGAFPTEAAYQKFLTKSGETEDDLLFRIRIDALSTKIRDASLKGIAKAAQPSALKNFVSTFQSRWKAETQCAPKYFVDLCGNAPPKSPAVPSTTTAGG